MNNHGNIFVWAELFCIYIILNDIYYFVEILFVNSFVKDLRLN